MAGGFAAGSTLKKLVFLKIYREESCEASLLSEGKY